MKNTDLFNFNFSNHEHEISKLTEILKNNNKDNIIWIDGNSGAGKSFFLKYNVVDNNLKEYEVFYIEKVGKEESKSYISFLAESLNKKSRNQSFISFLKNNYTGIVDVIKKTKGMVLSLSGVTDFGILDVALDFSKKFLSKNNECHDYTSVLIEYLDKLLKGEKIIIILDNFTLCDAESLDIISQLLYYYCGDKRIIFILVTTHQKLKERPDLITLVSEKVDVERITIEPFDDISYLFRMIDGIYDLHLCDEDDLETLFEICKGYPQKLKTFFQNLYIQNGIEFIDEKARIKQEYFHDLLLKEEYKISDLDYNSMKPNVKYLLQIIAAWAMPIRFTVLEKFSEYVNGIDGIWRNVVKKDIEKACIYLDELEILEYIYQEGNLKYIKFQHDSYYSTIYNFLKDNTVHLRFFHYCIYNFVINNKSLFKEEELSFLYSYNSWKAQVDDWVDINYTYGLKLIEDKQYKRGQKILDRIAEYQDKLTINQKLIIAENCYNVGKYEKARSILELIGKQLENIHDYQNRIDYFIINTKVNIMLFEYDQAIQQLDTVLKNEQILELDRITLLYFKFSILCMMPSGFNRAFQLFKNTVENYKAQSAMIKVYKSAMDYYKGDKSFELLETGLRIAKSTSELEEVAMLMHNIGFEYFRCGHYSKSKEYTEKGLNALKQYKQHETSYCLNNLAVIYMIDGEWMKALNLLNKSLFYNKSQYGAIAMKGNMMVCHYELGNDKLCNELMTELLNFLEENNNIDDKLYKKIYTNLAIILFKNHEVEKAKGYFNTALKYTKKKSKDSSARINKYLSLINNTSYKLKTNKYRDYYYDLPYEPWLLTFGHQ